MIELVKYRHYREIKTGKLIRFSHIGQTGSAVFYQYGEHSFQDCFAYTDNQYEDKIADLTPAERLEAFKKDEFLVALAAEGKITIR